MQLIIERFKDRLASACLILIASSPVVTQSDLSQIIELASFQFGEQRIRGLHSKKFFPFNMWIGLKIIQVNKTWQALYDRRSGNTGLRNKLFRKNVAVTRTLVCSSYEPNLRVYLKYKSSVAVNKGDWQLGPCLHTVWPSPAGEAPRASRGRRPTAVALRREERLGGVHATHGRPGGPGPPAVPPPHPEPE